MPPQLAVLAAVTLWGVSFVATRAALAEISPIPLVFTRFALGTALLLTLLTVRRRLKIPPRESWPALAAMGFLGIFLHQMLQAHGLTLTTAVHTGWLIGLIPIWSALLSAAVLRERFDSTKVAGLLLGFAGAALVVTRGKLSGGFLSLPTTRGDLLILASTLNWAVYSVVGRRTLARLGSARATAFAMLAGWAMLAPFFAFRAGWREYARVSPAGWGAILFLGIGCSGLGYLFWFAGLEKLETSRVAAFLYLEPLVTLAAAVVLLGEPVHWTTLAGGAIVLAGVFLVQRARKPVADRFSGGNVASGDLTPDVASGDLTP